MCKSKRKAGVITGIVAALVTPFDEAGELNLKVFRKLIRHVLKAGVHGVFAVGSSGEFYALSVEEKRALFETAVKEVNGAVPVYAGTGGITTKEAIRLTRMAEAVGVDAVSILTPMFIHPSDSELYSHYEALASSVGIPVILYTNPNRTGVDLSPELVSRLEKIDNIVGVKDSSGDLSHTMSYIRNTSCDFSVLAGQDTLIYATLCCGGTGAIAATANIVPSLVVTIYEAFIAGDHELARQAQMRLAPLREAFHLGTFPQVIKEGAKMSGIDVGSARPPVDCLTNEERKSLAEAIHFALAGEVVK